MPSTRPPPGLITLLESQRAFVEDASHQLRTPLTSLQLHLENLQAAVGSSNEVDLNYVLAEMNRLSRMVDSLLALARNESKSPVLVSIDVHDIVVERAEVWRALAGEVDLELVVDTPETLHGSGGTGRVGTGLGQSVVERVRRHPSRGESRDSCARDR